MIPCSIIDTSPCDHTSSTTILSSRICTRSLYMRVRTVASVARTQIFLYPLSTTASAPGTVTPRICRQTNTDCCIGRSAWTLAVLQASMTTSAHLAKSLSTPAYVRVHISSHDLPPYGAFFLSISSNMVISGYSCLNASITTCPPSPESKNQRIMCLSNISRTHPSTEVFYKEITICHIFGKPHLILMPCSCFSHKNILKSSNIRRK